MSSSGGECGRGKLWGTFLLLELGRLLLRREGEWWRVMRLDAGVSGTVQVPFHQNVSPSSIIPITLAQFRALTVPLCEMFLPQATLRISLDILPVQSRASVQSRMQS